MKIKLDGLNFDSNSVLFIVSKNQKNKYHKMYSVMLTD
jgi:hypothetical protein